MYIRQQRQRQQALRSRNSGTAQAQLLLCNQHAGKAQHHGWQRLLLRKL
jgi:hypothetical protein